MGADLYISIDRRGGTDPKVFDQAVWRTMFDGRSQALARGIIVEAFGTCGATPEEREENSPQNPVNHAEGYLTFPEWSHMQVHPECAWRLDEPYWVRRVDGREFVAIVREARWKTLEEGAFADQEADVDLKAFAAMVESLLTAGCEVRVWCWHSQ